MILPPVAPVLARQVSRTGELDRLTLRRTERAAYLAIIMKAARRAGGDYLDPFCRIHPGRTYGMVVVVVVGTNDRLICKAKEHKTVSW